MSEKELHKNICQFIKLQYPSVIFTTDGSGLRLSIGEAVRFKKLRSGNAIPDIVIYETTPDYCGLFLEIKKESPYKKDGTLKKNAHLQEQADMIENLNKRGYRATFVWEFDEAINIIKEYLCKKART